MSGSVSVVFVRRQRLDITVTDGTAVRLLWNQDSGVSNLYTFVRDKSEEQAGLGGPTLATAFREGQDILSCNNFHN